MKLIVGLGNPGPSYDQTRHNIGFKVVDELVTSLGLSFNQSKFNGTYATAHVDGEKVIILKPLTYMNLSGQSIRPMMDYFDIMPDELVVIYDDLDLPVGKLRLRQKGSAGGHNGIKSTIAHINTEKFNRIRIGIGRPPAGMAVPDYVLGKFKKEEQEEMEQVVQTCVKACEEWLERPFLEVMNHFNA